MHSDIDQQTVRLSALSSVRDQLAALLDLSDSLDEFLLSAHLSMALDTTHSALEGKSSHL